MSKKLKKFVEIVCKPDGKDTYGSYSILMIPTKDIESILPERENPSRVLLRCKPKSRWFNGGPMQLIGSGDVHGRYLEFLKNDEKTFILDPRKD